MKNYSAEIIELSKDIRMAFCVLFADKPSGLQKNFDWPGRHLFIECHSCGSSVVNVATCPVCDVPIPTGDLLNAYETNYITCRELASRNKKVMERFQESFEAEKVLLGGGDA